ncbi:Oidioi.mRNA.OKI2018_I69.chr2.g4841.t1.cds [Oikopleura dioica]|uniref:Oidioi.mRNA.OKI2018_I69.chr2.g4841.t1.cds n=1 Tax=Oikopleura dioica TaxID=34765 RepID=A0ABN7T443_OIKDI|nr:Oidioi.mRNA.OKI2018_I69.chr2.g4841.t1.cds [Oikopleura dioica]
MKLSPFLTVLAGSGQAQPLTFWRESDLFAYQVREHIPKNGLGNRFIKKYDEVRDVMRWFRDEGICDTDVTSPSYESSYACIEDQAANEEVQQALFEIRKIAKKNINRDKDVSFHISDDMMTYDQARAYCFSKGMWLANPKNDGEQSGMINAMEFRKWTWFNPSKAVDGECWMQQKFKPTDTNPAGLWDGPVGCKNRAHAVCQNGQIFEKSCLSFPIAPMRTTEQSLAQEYCELAGGNLPFFNSKKELAEWQNRPDPQQEWLGIVRNADFESGWATVTGEEATVFAWYDGEPNNYLDHEYCAATDMALKNDPLAWNDVPCDWFEQMFRCRIDSTIYVWEDCPVPVMPDPPACEDPCEGKENCTTFVDSCEIYPEEATVVGTISPTSKHYKISFDFKCTDEIDSFLTVPSANVLRLDSYPDPPPSSITWENRGVTVLEVGTLRENPLEYWVYGNAFTREQILNKDLYTKQSCTTEWDSFTLERSDVDGTNSRSTLIRHSDGATLIDYVQPTDDIPDMPPVLYARVSSNIYEPSRLYPVRNYYYEEIPMPEPVKHFLIMGIGNRWGGATTSSLTIATDGSTGTGATIDAPVWNYLADVTHAVVKGELYIFGGWTAETKVNIHES